MLTDIQKHEFETFGFLIVKNLIEMPKMRQFIDAFDDTMTKGNSGEPWPDDPICNQVIPFYEYNPEIYHQLLDHEKLNEVLEDLLGKDYVFLCSEGIHFFGGSRWHHDDIAPEGQTHLKTVFFLNPVRSTTGCLRVLPCTHFPPMRERMEDWYERQGEWDSNPWPAGIALESDPGDAVIFNVKVYHAAITEGAQRRGIYVNYIQNPKTPEQEEYITETYRRHHPLYTSSLFEDASPQRMRMLSFLKETCYDPV